MVRIVCQHCQKQLSIDESKLPNHEVAFQCPACKERVTYDRSKVESQAVPPASTAQPEQAHAAWAPEPGNEDEDDFRPKALIVGTDTPAVRAAIASIDMQAVVVAPEAAREFYLREYPPVVFLVPARLSAPPLTEMMPIISVLPVDRRKGFFILVSDNLKTLDGNAAFLYNVNLVIANRDLPSFRQIYKDAVTFHQRLYQSMNAVLD